MGPPARRLLAALALLLAAGTLAGTLSGCGSASATLDPVAQAAEVTSAAGTVHMSFAMTIGSPALSSPITANGSGYFDYAQHDGAMSFTLEGIPAAEAAAAGAGQLHIEEVLEPDALYLTSPLFAGHLPGGARWLRIDLSKLDGGLDVESLESGESNPAQFLEYLRAHGGSATKVGTEELDGVQTTHYRGSVDLSDALAKLPAAERASAEAMLEQAGISSIPFDAWIDAQHRVRRLQMSFAVKSAQTSVQITIGFSDYGQSIPPVAAPAGPQVAELPTGLHGL